MDEGLCFVPLGARKGGTGELHQKIEIYWDLIDGIQWDFNGNHGILWIFSWDFMDFNGTKHWMFFISQIRMERFGDLSLGNDLPSELNLHI